MACSADVFVADAILLSERGVRQRSGESRKNGRKRTETADSVRTGSVRFEQVRRTSFGSMPFAADCEVRYGLKRLADRRILRIGTVRRIKSTVRTDECGVRYEAGDDTIPERA